MIDGIEKLLKKFDVPIDFMLWLAVAAGFLMMMHTSVDVFGRTVLNRPLPGTTEIVSAYYMVAASYLPWAWIARGNSHIMVELFTRSAPRWFNEWLDIFVKVATGAYVSVFTWQTGVRAIQQTGAGEVWQAAEYFIPVWPSRWMLPIAGALMVLYLVLRVIADIARAVQR